jgi:hypothetical protein
MKIKTIIGLILAAAILVGLCSCAGSQTGASEKTVQTGSADNTVQASAASNTDSERTGVDIDDTEVLLADNVGEAETNGNSLGNAVMVPDEGKLAAVTYSPLGGAVFLELQDSAGNLWRLDIPENALPYGENITMQLSKSITSDVVSGELNSGVILEPEGLQFTIPATLTIKGPAAADQTYIFYGDHAGDNLNFAQPKVDADSLKVTVGHFSSYIVYQPIGDSQIQEAADLAAESYKAVLDEVKTFLKTSVSAPPIPADYSFECKEEDGENASQLRNRALDAYINSVMQPESDLARRLLGSGYEVAKLGGETDAFYYAGLLLERDLKKADKLIRTYMNDNDKLIPVMNLTFKVMKEMQALGVDVPSGYLQTFSEWMARAADEQIRKIREDHNYKALGPAIALAKGSAIMESDFSASIQFTQKFMEKIKKAMTFKVKYEASLFAGHANQKMTLEGEAEVLFLDENNENSYTGTGKGKYLSYSHSGPWVTTIDFPNEYPVKIKFIDFSPCTSKKVKVQVDTIGSKNEVWYNSVLDEKITDQYSFVNFMADELFNEYKKESGEFVFEVPFHNKNVIMGDGSFAKTATINYPEDGNASGSISYRLEIRHTPK